MNRIKWLNGTTLPNDFVIKEYLDRPIVKMYHGASKKTRTDVRRGCPLYTAMLHNGWTDMGEIEVKS